MKDLQGKEIKVGDTIVTSKQSTRRGAHQGVQLAIVEGFSPQKVRTNHGRTHYPSDVVIIYSAPEIMTDDTQMSMGV